MVEPRPGDFGLTKVRGLTGAFINFGQWFIGDFSPVQHALVYVGFGHVVQAMPSGAELIKLEDASPVVKWSTDLIPLTDEERTRIKNEALDLVGTPYSFLDYISLALERLRIRPKLIRDIISSNRSLICSQLVDVAYQRAGVHLFEDGRMSGDVSPGDLWKLLKEKEANAGK